jgi:prophage regulatory protein
MDFQRNDKSPKMILRLTEVLQSTGLSRAMLYNRIAKGEFPRQVSLGGRAIGWIKGEVEDWISERISLRPECAAGIPERAPDDGYAIPKGIQNGCEESRRSMGRACCALSVNDGSPDPTNLHLVGTKVYFDRSTGSFWLKLVAEGSTGNVRRPHKRT